ncbi:MAG TPA: outer membrane lipoprotein carrier protein LolA [Polyangiaceae bacterium]|nr:outer membrane lipoprotein carrier protein LolA [Polyangiaceae bacterium]
MQRRLLSWLTVGLMGSLVAGAAFADPPAAPAATPAPAAPPAAAPAKPLSGPSADEIADRVQAFYDRTKTFRAGFRQRYTVAAYNKVKDSSGSVVFEKPGKMSWRYTNNGNRVVSDGKLIRIYEKENKQMYEQPLEKSQYPAALSFLTGTGSIKQFKLTKLDPKQLGFEGGYVLLGEPREPNAAYQKVFLYVDAGTYQVRRVMLLDAQRNRNRFDFVNPEVNTKAAPGEFTFSPPPGTQVIRP